MTIFCEPVIIFSWITVLFVLNFILESLREEDLNKTPDKVRFDLKPIILENLSRKQNWGYYTKYKKKSKFKV